MRLNVHPEMLSEASQKLNLLIAVVGALLCVSPLFSRQDHSSVKNNFEVTLVVDPLLQRSSSILAPFFIVLIPVADLLLDLPLKVFSYLHPEKSSAKCHKSSVVVRLKDIEKLVFMVGMGVQSSVWFLPSSMDLAFVGLAYSVTFGASMIIVLTPILTFLQRCTTTFTTLSATAITVTSSVGVAFFAVRYFVRNDHHSFMLLTYFGWCLCGFAAAVFMLLVVVCAFKYCHHKLQTTSDRQALLVWLRNPFKKTSPPSKGYTNKATDNDSELYTNYVPAMHMISMVVIILSGIYVGVLPGEHQNLAHERKNYTIIAAEIVILVIELRIRKNEIARGLVRNVDRTALLCHLFIWKTGNLQ
jgi:cytochrome b subunit of formate dehydrogenase